MNPCRPDQIGRATAFAFSQLGQGGGSGFSNLNELLVDNNVSFILSLNISGFTTLNKTTILSSLNVSGLLH